MVNLRINWTLYTGEAQGPRRTELLGHSTPVRLETAPTRGGGLPPKSPTPLKNQRYECLMAFTAPYQGGFLSFSSEN